MQTKALVVDDSRVMRKVAIGALGRIDIVDVEQAADGQEAVDKCQQNEYQLVLMDWNMPNKSGFDALKEIRANGKTMPIIMVTTEAERARIVQAIQAGATNYIVKPFEPDVFIEKIKSVLPL